MRMNAFARLGHAVGGVHTIEAWKQASWLKRQFQRRLGRGSVIDEINRFVLDAARTFRPDLGWGEKQETSRARTGPHDAKDWPWTAALLTQSSRDA